MPVSVGRLLTSSVNASMPPADAPTAAIRRSFLRSGGGPSPSAALRGWFRPDDFGFIFTPNLLNGWVFTRQGGARVGECRYNYINNGFANTCALASAARIATSRFLSFRWCVRTESYGDLHTAW